MAVYGLDTKGRGRHPTRRDLAVLAAAGLALCAIAGPAWAQSQSQPAAASRDQGDDKDFFTGFWRRPTMLGDIFGLRPWLGRYGLSFTMQEVSEVLGNATGGVKQGPVYDGLTTATLQLDTAKAFGLEAGLFNVSALQIHGRNLSAENLQSLQTASGIEADRATRLWELWYQQGFLEGDLDVKLGQQSLDQEFMVTTNGLLFVNTMFGWAMVPSADLPSGGPAYPLSSLGVRLRGKATSALTVLAGVFDDNPAGPTAGDPQLADHSGTNFRTSDGALLIAEAQYALNQPALGEMEYPGQERPGLPGVYRFGLWYDTGNFADQRFDNTGLSLADPASSGVPRNHSGNFSLYAVMDQMIWHEEEGARAVSIFARAMGAPADRNLISFGLNAGVTLKEPFPGREDDTLGLGFGYAQVSGRAAGLDRDTGVFTASLNPVRSSEKIVELTYQYQLTPWWQLQPDLQLTLNPGGGILDPNTGARVRNEAVLGLRTTITF